MNNRELAPMTAWLIEPIAADVKAAIERLRRAPDVQRLAIMPDVHLSADVCIGCVVGTSHLLYPQAVGGDIGCGMLAMKFNTAADRVDDPTTAGKILRELSQRIPIARRHRLDLCLMPNELIETKLSDLQLEAMKHRDGALQLGTLGSGNHFIELQADEDGQLWVMIHSGSRGIGQAIRDYHLAKAAPVGSQLRALDAFDERGEAYLADVRWATKYAEANRDAMARKVAEVLYDAISASPEYESVITTDHNHVRAEVHEGQKLFVHRKGAMPANEGLVGVLPGSMGTPSFHVVGRGHPESLRSSAHGAGRRLSRQNARRQVSPKELVKQMTGIWFDYRMTALLREESPEAYKDVQAVLRAQADLVKVLRRLRPLLSFKGV